MNRFFIRTLGLCLSACGVVFGRTAGADTTSSLVAQNQDGGGFRYDKYSVVEIVTTETEVSNKLLTGYFSNRYTCPSEEDVYDVVPRCSGHSVCNQTGAICETSGVWVATGCKPYSKGTGLPDPNGTECGFYDYTFAWNQDVVERVETENIYSMYDFSSCDTGWYRTTTGGLCKPNQTGTSDLADFADCCSPCSGVGGNLYYGQSGTTGITSGWDGEGDPVNGNWAWGVIKGPASQYPEIGIESCRAYWVGNDSTTGVKDAIGNTYTIAMPKLGGGTGGCGYADGTGLM